MESSGLVFSLWLDRAGGGGEWFCILDSSGRNVLKYM